MRIARSRTFGTSSFSRCEHLLRGGGASQETLQFNGESSDGFDGRPLVLKEKKLLHVRGRSG